MASFLPFESANPSNGAKGGQGRALLDAQRSLPLFLPCAPGFEGFLAEEVSALGRYAGQNLRAHPKVGGVEVAATMPQIFYLALGSRLALGLWLRCAEFPARHFSQFESGCRALKLHDWIGGDGPVYLKVSTTRSRLYHTKAISERFFRFSGLSSASVEDEQSVRVMIRIARDKAVVSLDLAGGLLCKRGWRLQTAKAPLRKDLAARMLVLSGWEPGRILLDPMCGSGTIPIEAARWAAGVWPNGLRRFALERFPGWDVSLLSDIRRAGMCGTKAQSLGATSSTAEPVIAAPETKDQAGAAEFSADPTTAVIVGGDQNAGGIAIAKANAERAGITTQIRWETRAMSDWSASASAMHLVCNPPFGQRVGKAGQLGRLFAELGELIIALGAQERFALIAPPGPWIQALTQALGQAPQIDVYTDFGGTKVALYGPPS